MRPAGRGVNADGPAEVVVDGKTGYIVAREDAHAAADRLQELVLNPELRQRLGAAGRAACSANTPGAKAWI